jgi:hypothetical protein
MADAADDRDLVAKSVRPVGPQAIPPRSGEAMRRLADLTYPLKPDGESRCLSVGRGITLSGEVNSCDKLPIEGSVDSPHIEALLAAWLDAGDLDGQRRICAELQMQLWQDVPCIPMGQYWQSTAYRKDLLDVLPGCFAVFYGVRRA